MSIRKKDNPRNPRNFSNKRKRASQVHFHMLQEFAAPLIITLLHIPLKENAIKSEW